MYYILIHASPAGLPSFPRSKPRKLSQASFRSSVSTAVVSSARQTWDATAWIAQRGRLSAVLPEWVRSVVATETEDAIELGLGGGRKRRTVTWRTGIRPTAILQRQPSGTLDRSGATFDFLTA